MNYKLLKHKSALIVALLAATILTACSETDCPLNNSVYCNYELQGKVTTLPEMLTISTAKPNGSDSVLINQQTNTKNFALPMSFAQDEDVLYFNTNNILDTVIVKKTNRPHFESVDCGVNFFHTITGVEHTRHAIDSITINQKEVTYDISQMHLFIYFKEYRF